MHSVYIVLHIVFCAKSIVIFVRSIVVLANPEARSMRYDMTQILERIKRIMVFSILANRASFNRVS